MYALPYGKKNKSYKETLFYTNLSRKMRSVILVKYTTNFYPLHWLALS